LRVIDLCILLSPKHAFALQFAHPFLLPVGNQLVQRARVENVARQNVRAGLGALLDDAHLEVLSVLGAQLPQTNRGRQTGRAGADNDDVVLHRLARRAPRVVVLGGRSLRRGGGRGEAAVMRH
jgi:hypothetical protein